MRRFFCTTIPEVGGDFWLDGDEACHAVKVLRLGAGTRVEALDGHGVIAEAVVTAVNRERREERLGCRVEARRVWAPAVNPVHLLVGPPRAKLMGQVVRQATELGVWRLTPVLCAYSVARPDAAGGGLGHWRGEALAAIKQSGNPFLPQLDEPMSFADAVAAVPGPGIFGAPVSAGGGRAFNFPAAGTVLPVWIGPEGGFNEEETAALQAGGHCPLALGRWVLRVETAVTAILGHLNGLAGIKAGHCHADHGPSH